MDAFTISERSRIMSRVKSKGNKSTEQALIALMRREHLIGWRRKSNLPGNPDFIFPTKKIAVFVDGCHWHGCKKHLRLPKSNRKYWKKKIWGNVVRDARVKRTLIRAGWRVCRIWEHEIKKMVEAKKLSVIRALILN